MFETNSFYLKDTHKSEEVMSGKREFCVAQLIGVFLFCFGLAGGILIGIYLYHGGPDSEVSCKVYIELISYLFFVFIPVFSFSIL
jgi:hypothetical protein